MWTNDVTEHLYRHCPSLISPKLAVVPLPPANAVWRSLHNPCQLPSSYRSQGSFQSLTATDHCINQPTNQGSTLGGIWPTNKYLQIIDCHNSWQTVLILGIGQKRSYNFWLVKHVLEEVDYNDGFRNCATLEVPRYDLLVKSTSRLGFVEIAVHERRYFWFSLDLFQMKTTQCVRWVNRRIEETKCLVLLNACNITCVKRRMPHRPPVHFAYAYEGWCYK